MDAQKIAARAKEIAEEIKDRRMIFTDQDWPDDTGDQYDKVYTYVYYTYLGTPVRVHRRPEIQWAGAERLNFRTGQFDDNDEVNIRMEYDENKGGGDVGYVRSKEEFYKLCDDYMAEHTPERIAEREESARWWREESQDFAEEIKQQVYELERKAGLHPNDD